jgi:hypothetical protein
LGLVQVKRWQANIYIMLRCIPFIPTINSIKAKLSLNENLEETPTLLELAIWKSIITKHLVFGGSNGNPTYDILKMQCRAYSLTMVTIIVLNVLSFLTDSNDCNGVNVCYGHGDRNGNNEEEDDEDNNNYENVEGGDEDNDVNGKGIRRRQRRLC